MRDSRLDEDEVACGVFDAMHEPFAEIVPDPSLEDVEHDLEPDVNVRAGDATRGNHGDVHRQRLGADVLPRHTELVLDAIPLTAHAAAPDPGEPREAFDGGVAPCGHYIAARGSHSRFAAVGSRQSALS